MSDKRLIDANALLKECEKRQEQQTNEYCDCFLNDAQEISTEWWCVEDMVMAAPTIDAVEVVRCKECVFRGCSDLCPICWCVSTMDVTRVIDITEDDGFCHRGAKVDAKDMDVHAKEGGAV